MNSWFDLLAQHWMAVIGFFGVGLPTSIVAWIECDERIRVWRKNRRRRVRRKRRHDRRSRP